MKGLELIFGGIWKYSLDRALGYKGFCNVIVKYDQLICIEFVLYSDHNKTSLS